MENLTITEIQDRCDAMAKAMGEKGVVTPEVRHVVVSGGKIHINLWSSISRPHFNGGKDYVQSFPDFDAASAFIAALPDPATEGERKFTRALADAIDIATEYALPDAVVAPVREAQKVVNAVLLEGPK